MDEYPGIKEAVKWLEGGVYRVKIQVLSQQGDANKTAAKAENLPVHPIAFSIRVEKTRGGHWEPIGPAKKKKD